MTTAYATLANLYTVMPLTMMGNVAVATQQALLTARNAGADSYLRARYRLPAQTPYPPDLVLSICQLAAADIMRVRGFNPAAGADVIIMNSAENATKWLEGVERQRIHPALVEAVGSEDPGYAAPLVISKPIRGWYPGTSDT